jgi:hypothetical protein
MVIETMIDMMRGVSMTNTANQERGEEKAMM